MSTKFITLDWGTSGLVGTIAYRVLDTAGTTLIARTTSGITEVPASSGLYQANVSGWSDAWEGKIVWDAGSTDYAVEAFAPGVDIDSITSAMAGLISTGTNTFRSPMVDGVLTLPQSMDWSEVTPITIARDGASTWPDDLTGWTIALHVVPDQRYIDQGYDATVYVYAGTSSGTGDSAAVQFQPTNTASLQPTLADLCCLPYSAEVWATSGAKAVKLFEGGVDVPADRR